MDEKYLKLFLTTKDGEWMDFDEIMHLDVEDIPWERVPKLIELLTPIESLSIEDLEIPLSAARLLSSWGDETGLNYLGTLVNQQESWNNYAPHRLRGYDTTCEVILDAILFYWARHADRGKEYGEVARKEISTIVRKIIKLSNQIPFEIKLLYLHLESWNWPEYTEAIKEHLETILLDPKKHHWKVEDALDSLDKIDPEYTAKIRTKYKLVNLR